jgi:hypothetical protein
LARTAYEDFLRVWDQADGDVPEIVIARRRLAERSSTTSNR